METKKCTVCSFGRNRIHPTRRPKNIIYMSVSGAIGSGKSSLIHTISKCYESSKLESKLPYDMVFETEPVDEWEDDEGINWLDLFYKDPERWAFGFQMKVISGQIGIKQRIESSYRGDRPLIVVTERSPFDGQYIFSSILVESGKMQPHEFGLLKEYIQKAAWMPDYTIWVSTDSKVCIDRIKRRNRGSEVKVDEAYYEKICQKYSEEMKKISPKKLLTIDNNTDDPIAYHSFMKQCVTDIEEWIHQIVTKKE